MAAMDWEAMTAGWQIVPRTLSPSYDFAVATRPTMFYVVASTPRTGSTLLCQRLWATGAMGAPAEYFNYHLNMIQMVARLRVASLEEYVDRLFALRTSPNGVFGLHAHWDQFHFAVTAGILRRMHGFRCIHIERRDRLAQAVSFARALESGQWASTHRARNAPAYDRKRIERCLARIEAHDGQWQSVFRRNRMEPIRVTYESLRSDPDAVLGDILSRFGVAADPSRRVSLPDIRPQSDDTSREWIDRYRREEAERESSPDSA